MRLRRLRAIVAARGSALDGVEFELVDVGGRIVLAAIGVLRDQRRAVREAIRACFPESAGQRVRRKRAYASHGTLTVFGDRPRIPGGRYGGRVMGVYERRYESRVTNWTRGDGHTTIKWTDSRDARMRKDVLKVSGRVSVVDRIWHIGAFSSGRRRHRDERVHADGLRSASAARRRAPGRGWR